MTNNLSMQDLLDQQEQEFSAAKNSIGKIVSVKIEKITHDGVSVYIEGSFDGVIPTDEFSKDERNNLENVYKVGDEISAMVKKVYQKDGIMTLSKKDADKKIAADKKAAQKKEAVAEIKSAFEDRKIITVNIEKSIPKGLFGTYKTETVFIPLSQIDTKFVNNTASYENRNLEVYVIEFDLKKNRLVGSHRAVAQERLDAEKAAERARAKAAKEAKIAKVKQEKEDSFNSLEVGQKREGKVTKIMSYGAFVDIGGLEGLVHLNNLSWQRVENIEDVVKEGDKVSVYVIEINKDTNKVGLALKDMSNDPWSSSNNDIEVGDIFNGIVMKIIDKGAFVEIFEGVEGYLPISELSEERVTKVTNVINVGDEIPVLVTSINLKNRRMTLSMKEATKEPEEDYTEFLEVEESMGTLGDLFKDKFKNLEK